MKSFVFSGMIGKKRISSLTQANATPYIVGGVLGFFVLAVLISVIVYCLHKKRKVGKDDNVDEPHKSHSQNNNPSMPSITDCFTHAQFQSVVNFPKSTDDSPFQRQRSVRFNYKVMVYGYDPRKIVRKSLKIKRKVNKIQV